MKLIPIIVSLAILFSVTSCQVKGNADRSGVGAGASVGRVGASAGVNY